LLKSVTLSGGVKLPKGRKGGGMKLYTVPEAAELLRLCPGSVYALCRLGKIRHERHGQRRGKILIPEDALEEYRKGGTVGAEEAKPPPAPKPVRLTHLRWPS
jgi:excisionase family DNA binding protein